MIERVSIGSSILIHVALIMLISMAVIKSPLVELQQGMEIEIVDFEHSLPSPDPQIASSSQQDPVVASAAAHMETLESSPVPQAILLTSLPPVRQSAPTRAPAISPRSLGPAPVDPIDVSARSAGAISEIPTVAPVVTQPPVQPAATPGLDSSAISRTLGKTDSTRERTRLNSAAIGSAIGRATPKGLSGLTVRQRADLAQMVRSQVIPCWNPPSTESPAGASVTLRFRLSREGQVIGQPAVTRSTAESSTSAAYLSLLTGSGRRAILLCAPLELPSELYDAWSEVEVEFDPRNTR